MKLDFSSLGEIIAALLAGGGITAFFARRRTDSEADKFDHEAKKIRAEVDEMTWEHAKETIIQLQADVGGLLAGRKMRDKQIAGLKHAIADCSVREKDLIVRIGGLEKAIASGAALVRHQAKPPKT